MMTIHALPTWLREIKDIRVNAQSPEWLVTEKERAFNALIKSGIPSRKHEKYKYTDFSFTTDKHYQLSPQKEFGNLSDFVASSCVTRHFIVMVNGVFKKKLSALPEALTVMSLKDAMIKHPEWIKSQLLKEATSYFSELNQAFFLDGLFFEIPDDYQSDEPLHILSIITKQNDCLIVPRNVFMIGENAKVNILEEYIAKEGNTYFNNVVTHWHLKKSAKVKCYKKQNEHIEAAHYATNLLELGEDSHFELVNITKGGIFSRDDVIARLQGIKANCLLSGFYHLERASQYVDHHVEVIHEAKYSQSEMLYKGILDSESRAVFNGRLNVVKDADRINAYQANHHLLLSSEAEAYSKPELEIYAEDVKCKHGATTGQLDEDALFYLQSRGIEERDAKSILIQGFAEEILKRIHSSIREHFAEVL